MRPSLAFTELIALICVRAMAVVQKICCARRALDPLVFRQTRIQAKVPISADSVCPEESGTPWHSHAGARSLRLYPLVYLRSAGSPARIDRSELCCRFGTLPASAAVRMAAMLPA